MTKRINVLCEGPTEEQFVSKVLSKYFQEKNIVLTPRSLDGGFNYHRLKYEVIRWLNHEKSAFVTTLIDFYGRKGTYLLPNILTTIQKRHHPNEFKKLYPAMTKLLMGILF